jgi:hypothetical protein
MSLSSKKRDPPKPSVQSSPSEEESIGPDHLSCLFEDVRTRVTNQINERIESQLKGQLKDKLEQQAFSISQALAKADNEREALFQSQLEKIALREDEREEK